MALPGWNTPATVQSVHAWFEAGALFFFAALVVFDVLAHLAPRESVKEKRLERIGLVCFGIAVLAEIIAYPYGQRNDDLASSRIADLNLEANKAMERASLADERASKFATDAEDLRKQVATANERSAILNRKAEDERRARVELEDRVAWRSFSREQQDDLEKSLSRFATQAANCAFLSGDMEAFSFASEMAESLRAVGWRVVPPDPNVMVLRETEFPNAASPIRKIDFGVEVVSTPDPPAIASAHAVVDELNRLGFDASFVPTPQRPRGSVVWITVQHRPLGAQGEAKLRAEKKKPTAAKK